MKKLESPCTTGRQASSGKHATMGPVSAQTEKERKEAWKLRQPPKEMKATKTGKERYDAWNVRQQQKDPKDSKRERERRETEGREGERAERERERES